jgi:hypothetical protein
MAWQWKVLVRAGAALAAAALAAEGCGHGSIDLFVESAAESGGAGGDSAWPAGQETGGDYGQGGGRNSSGGSGPWPYAGCDLDHPCLTGLVCNNVGSCVQCTKEDSSQCGFPQPPVCNTARGLCVECISSLGCLEPDYGVCDSFTNTCRAACVRDDNCGPTAPHCRSDGVCVVCDPGLGDQCPVGFWCREGGFCGQCLYDGQCGYLTPYCNAAHRCVRCIVDAQCGDLYRCDSGTCVSTLAP